MYCNFEGGNGRFENEKDISEKIALPRLCFQRRFRAWRKGGELFDSLLLTNSQVLFSGSPVF